MFAWNPIDGCTAHHDASEGVFVPPHDVSVSLDTDGGLCPLYAEDEEDCCTSRSQGNSHDCKNYNAYQHPLFFFVAGNRACPALQRRHHWSMHGARQSSTGLEGHLEDSSESDSSGEETPPSSPTGTAPQGSPRPERGTLKLPNRCSCPACQCCLPSWFDCPKLLALRAAEPPADGCGTLTSAICEFVRRKDKASVLMYQLKTCEARWRPAHARYRGIRSFPADHHGNHHEQRRQGMRLCDGTTLGSTGISSVAGESVTPLTATTVTTTLTNYSTPTTALSVGVAANDRTTSLSSLPIVPPVMPSGPVYQNVSAAPTAPAGAGVVSSDAAMGRNPVEAAATFPQVGTRCPGGQPSPRFGHTAVLLSDKETMLVFGGKTVTDYLNDAHVYDIAQGRWTRHLCPTEGSTAPWPAPRSGHTAVMHKDFMYVVSGGINDSNSCADDLWRLHVPSGVWARECERLPFSPRKGHTTHLLPAADTSGRAASDMLVVFGGLVRLSRSHPRPGDSEALRALANGTTPSGGATRNVGEVSLATNDVCLYHLDSGRWKLLKTSGEPPAPRFYHVSEIIEGTTLMLVFGGRTNNAGLPPAASEPATPLPDPRNAGSTSMLTVAPGVPRNAGTDSQRGPPTTTAPNSVNTSTTTGNAFFNDLYLLEISTGVWRPVSGVHGDIPSPRTCCASIFANGVFAVFAGGSADFSDGDYQFNIVTRRWTRMDIQNEPACSRPTVVFTGSRLIFYGGCARSNRVLGRGKNGILELPLCTVSMRDQCDMWVRRTTFNELFSAATKRCGGAAAMDNRFPAHTFPVCWTCSPSSMQGSPSGNAHVPGVQPGSSRSNVNASLHSARSTTATPNPSSATLRPRMPPGAQLRLSASPQPYSPSSAAAMERAGAPPMSPTEPLPSTGLMSSPGVGNPRAGQSIGPNYGRRCVYPGERVASPSLAFERAGAVGSPTSSTNLTGPSFDDATGQPGFPRQPVYASAQVGGTSPPAAGHTAVKAPGGPGLRVWVPPHCSPRGSHLASPRGLVGTNSALTASAHPSPPSYAPVTGTRPPPPALGGQLRHPLQAPPPPQPVPHEGGSRQTSPALRPAMHGAVPPPLPQTMVGAGRRYVPAVDVEGSRRSRPSSPLYRDVRVPGFGAGPSSPQPQFSARLAPCSRTASDESRRENSTAAGQGTSADGISPRLGPEAADALARLEELRGNEGPYVLRCLMRSLWRDGFKICTGRTDPRPCET